MSATGGKSAKKSSRSSKIAPEPSLTPSLSLQGSSTRALSTRYIEDISSSPPSVVLRSGLQYTPYRSASSTNPFLAAAIEVQAHADRDLQTVMSPRPDTRPTTSPLLLHALPGHLARPGLSPLDALRSINLGRSPLLQQRQALRTLSQEIQSAVQQAPAEVASSTPEERYRLAAQLNEILASELEALRRKMALEQEAHQSELEFLRSSAPFDSTRARHTNTASQPIVVSSSSESPPHGSPAHSAPSVRHAGHPATGFGPAGSTAEAPLQPKPPAASQPQHSSQWLSDAAAARTQSLYLQQQSQERKLLEQQAQSQQQLAIESEQVVIAQAQQRIAAMQRNKLSFKVLTEEGIIDEAQQRITDMQQSKLTFKVRKPTQRARNAEAHAVEKRVAAITGDHELLQHGSTRIKDEPASDDDALEVQRELSTAVAAHNLFNPKAPKAVRSKHGYVKNKFVASSDENASDADSPEEGDNSSDPDYEQTNSPTPSPSRKSMAISAQEWREFKAFKRAQQNPAQPPPPSQQQQQQSGSRETLPTFNIVISQPPEHGDWRDVQYLTTTFKDKHLKYQKSCGSATHLSVWECYSETAREQIVKQLNKARTGTARDAAYLSSLTDSDLYKILGEELGLSYTTEVEQALNAVKFQGSVLERSDWVIFNTSWCQVLRRVTDAGALQPRRMVELFRDNIPDAFIREWLRARRFSTWEEAYDGITAAIDDSKWSKCYLKDAIQRLATQPAAPKQHTPQSSAAPAAPSSAKTPTVQPPPAQERRQQTRAFNPLTHKNKRGDLNVNPNMSRDVPNLNPERKQCDRCKDGTIHPWLKNMCTTALDRNKKPISPELSAEEFRARLKLRWDAGFFFTKPIVDYTSPTAQTSAADSAQANKRIAAGSGGPQ